MIMQDSQRIEFQGTRPMPTISSQPTLLQLRLLCRMSRQQLSQAAGVRLCFVDWMERGIQVNQSDALKVLLVLSQRTLCWYRIEDIRGLHIRHDMAH